MKMGEVGSFVATWVPGSQHQAADALSRSPAHQVTPDDECGEDSNSQTLQNMVVSELQASHTDLRLQEVRAATSADPEMQLLIDTIVRGFPASRADVAEPVRKFWPMHDRLTVDDGLVMCGRRIVVPASLRRSTLKSLHAGHLGKERTKARARQVIYWPGVDADIDAVTGQCDRCQRELPSQPRESMLQHEPAARPFQILDMDFADHAAGKS